ncbi:MAG: hypothetical protein V1861_02605 [Candidatus Micrarchaeota archaeon]
MHKEHLPTRIRCCSSLRAAVVGIAILVSGPILPACGGSVIESRASVPVTELPHRLPARSELPEGTRNYQEHLMDVIRPSNSRFYSASERESANQRLLALLYNPGNQLSVDTLAFIASMVQDRDARLCALDRLRHDASALSRVIDYSFYSDTRDAAIQRIRFIAREMHYPDNNDSIVFIATYVDDRTARLSALERLRNDKDDLRFIIEESSYDDTRARAERYLERLVPAASQ